MIERTLLEQVGADAIAELVSFLDEVEAGGRNPSMYLLDLLKNTRVVRDLYIHLEPDDEKFMRQRKAFIQENPSILRLARLLRAEEHDDLLQAWIERQENPDGAALIRLQVLGDSMRAGFYPQLLDLAEALLEREDRELPN